MLRRSYYSFYHCEYSLITSRVLYSVKAFSGFPRGSVPLVYDVGMTATVSLVYSSLIRHTYLVRSKIRASPCLEWTCLRKQRHPLVPRLLDGSWLDFHS